MARNPSIRISPNDKTEYTKLARRAKAKINRIKKNYNIDLTQEINIPKINTFSTRDEYNDVKDKLSSFTNRFNLHYQFRKNKYGVVASVAEIQQGERRAKASQNRAKNLHKKVKDLPFYVNNQLQGTVAQRLGVVRRPEVSGIPIPNDFNFNTIPTRNVFEDRLRALSEKVTNEYYENAFSRKQDEYIQLLEAAFNSDADELVKKIRKLSSLDFMELYYSHDVFDFNLYDSENRLGLNDTDNVQAMLMYLDNYKRNDLAGF